MGNRSDTADGALCAVETIQDGLIGQVHQVHVWTNRPIWPQGMDRPPGEDPIPDTLDWDIWIGPAPMRPFNDKKQYNGNGTYRPFNWRGWHDFGTGALGDMACHTVNMPFRALKMGYPSVVECEVSSALHSETYPKTSRIRFDFPKREGLVPLKFWWYDGNPDDKISPLRPKLEVVRDLM